MFVDGRSNYISRDKTIAVVTDGAVFCKLNLPEHHYGANDKNHRYGELNNYQGLSRNDSQAACFETSLQNFYRFERRKIQRRIAAGNQSGEQAEADTCSPEINIFPGEIHFFICYLIEEGEDQLNQQQCKHKRKDRHQH